MALSGKDFTKLGIGGLALIVIIMIVFFGSFTKGCTRSTQTRSNTDGDDQKQTALTLKIEKVIASPTEKEAITIINTGSRTVDLTDWTLGDKNDAHARGLAGELKAGAHKVYDHDSLGFGINDKHETIYLKFKGQTIDRWEN